MISSFTFFNCTAYMCTHALIQATLYHSTLRRLVSLPLICPQHTVAPTLARSQSHGLPLMCLQNAAIPTLSPTPSQHPTTVSASTAMPPYPPADPVVRHCSSHVGAARDKYFYMSTFAKK